MHRVRYDLRWRRDHVPVLVGVLLAGAAAMACQDVRRPVRLGRVLPVDPRRVESVDLRLDPNTESAASLRRLSGLGPVRAGAIVEYRQSASRPFTQPADLEQVPGIGPLTAQRVAPYLSLPRGAE